MMGHILFIDDDPAELSSFKQIVAGHDDCTTLLWPKEMKASHEKLLNLDLVLSNLYLPCTDGDMKPTADQKSAITRAARRLMNSRNWQLKRLRPEQTEMTRACSAK